ncbi:MAG: Nif3-like dinuclear metal center hexameric protein [Erysipelotrichaceae bacterium]|jgi:hypothetical protein|nr:Nif3-like dinuclear metal center hexameric protein [Erysipelotrichaceae bacterium]
MLISEVIAKMKQYHKGTVNGKPIDEATTRDKILYGDPMQECTGILTSCWASVDVVRTAIERGANLIIVHEALFYNHGDHQDWLLESGNKTYLAKKELLDKHGIVVWRDHDYIHSGIPYGDGYVDGIFYGVMKKLDWEKYLVDPIARPMTYVLPKTTARKVGEYVKERFHLNGIKVLGDLDAPVEKVYISMHIMAQGALENEIIKKIDSEQIDCVLSLELIDYTVSEYIRDSAMLGFAKAILAVGHFNMEEYGMEYMLKYLPQALGEAIPASFVQSGDMYEFLV